MSIKAITNYKTSHCQLCGGACDQHPYLCEMHRPQKEGRIVNQYRSGLLTLGDWKPILMKDVELVTHHYERQSTDMYMNGILMRDRQLHGGVHKQNGHIFKRAVFKPIVDANVLECSVNMNDVQLRINSTGIEFGHAKYQYNIKLDITQWYLSEK